MMAIEQIIEKYLDDRDQVTDEELAALVEALEHSPKLAAELKEQLWLNELLGQRYGIDRQNFIAQVGQRIRDYRMNELELEEQVRDLQTLAEKELEQWSQRSRRSRLQKLWLTAAATLLLAVGAGVWSLWSPMLWRIAVVEFVGGGVVVRHGPAGKQPVSAGDDVSSGDVFRTARGQVLKFRYNDGSIVQVGSDSTIQFAIDRATRSKRILVHRGHVAAKVQPQKSGGPMVFQTPVAEAEVLGTELYLTVDPTGTRLDVTEGSVRLTRTIDGATVWVEAGYYGVSTLEQLTVHRARWPASRDGLVYLFQTGDQPNFVKDPATKMLRQCLIQPHGLAALNGDHVMVLGSGSVEPLGMDWRLLTACRKSHELAVEAVIQPLDLAVEGEARIITFSSKRGGRNFSLSQKGNKLLFHLRTSDTGVSNLQPEVELCRLPDSEPHHVLVTYRPGHLAAYLDGQQCCDHRLLTGDLSNWSTQHLLFGDDPAGGHDWAGLLEGVALYSRFIEADEARRNADAYLQLLQQRHQPQQR